MADKTPEQKLYERKRNAAAVGDVFGLVAGELNYGLNISSLRGKHSIGAASTFERLASRSTQRQLSAEDSAAERAKAIARFGISELGFGGSVNAVIEQIGERQAVLESASLDQDASDRGKLAVAEKQLASDLAAERFKRDFGRFGFGAKTILNFAPL